MLNFEDILFKNVCRKLRHIASQLRLFEINQSKTKSVHGGAAKYRTSIKTDKNVYLGVPGINCPVKRVCHEIFGLQFFS